MSKQYVEIMGKKVLQEEIDKWVYLPTPKYLQKAEIDRTHTWKDLEFPETGYKPVGREKVENKEETHQQAILRIIYNY